MRSAFSRAPAMAGRGEAVAKWAKAGSCSQWSTPDRKRPVLSGSSGVPDTAACSAVMSVVTTGSAMAASTGSTSWSIQTTGRMAGRCTTPSRSKAATSSAVAGRSGWAVGPGMGPGATPQPVRRRRCRVCRRRVPLWAPLQQELLSAPGLPRRRVGAAKCRGPLARWPPPR